jgi:hypothetical protein
MRETSARRLFVLKNVKMVDYASVYFLINVNAKEDIWELIAKNIIAREELISVSMVEVVMDQTNVHVLYHILETIARNRLVVNVESTRYVRPQLQKMQSAYAWTDIPGQIVQKRNLRHFQKTKGSAKEN